MDKPKFDDYQLSQFLIAEQNYGNMDSEIKNHPEWSGTFMNFYLNSEGKGEDCSAYFIVAQWLSESKLPGDAKKGTIGNDMNILSDAINLARKGVSLPKELPMKDGEVDEFMLRWVLMQMLYNTDGRERLKSGRYAYGDHVGMLDDGVFFSEGIKEADDALTELCRTCSHYTEQQSPDGNAYAYLAMKLALDDMNIRGQQILDAVEYAGNVQELYRLLNRPLPESTRAPEIAKYVNRKAAERIRDGKSKAEPVAVDGGASFDKAFTPVLQCHNPELAAKHYRMTEIDYEQYLAGIKKLDEDYKNIDVINGTNLNLALRACQARGFEMVRMGGVRDDGSRGILLWNPVTGAFVTFDSAQEDNACYGGGDLDFFDAGKEHISWRMLSHGSSGGVHDYEEAIWHQLTYHHGLFREYDQIAGMLHAEDVDWERIGFGITRIPFCEYYKSPYFNEPKLAEKIGYKDAHMICDMGGFHLQQFINLVLTYYDGEIDISHAAPYKIVKRDTMPRQCLNIFILWVGEMNETMKLMRLAKLMLQMPDEEFKKFTDALYERCVDENKKQQERIGAEENPVVKRRMKEDFKDYVKAYGRNKRVLEGFKNEEKIADELLRNATPPTKCGVKLPWL